MTAPSGTRTRGRGRPRSPQTDERILAAAFATFAEHGYDAMSIDAVAGAAGVSKATIYRRYDDKADLLTAAIAAQPFAREEPASGDAHTRLLHYADSIVDRLVHQGGMQLLIQVLAAAEHSPRLLELHRARKLADKREEIAAIVAQGVAAGELRADADSDTVGEAIAGAVMARAIRGGDFDDRWSRDIVDLVWSGIAVPS